MKLFTYILSASFCICAFQLSAQKPTADKGQGIRESSLPEQWAVPVGSANQALKQDAENISEANTKLYKSLSLVKKGNTESLASTAGMDSKTLKLVVLVENKAAWAAPLRNNELNVDANAAKILAKYNLSVSKFYGADETLDGVVIKCNESGMNLDEAAKELSLLEGVAVVHLKAQQK